MKKNLAGSGKMLVDTFRVCSMAFMLIQGNPLLIDIRLYVPYFYGVLGISCYKVQKHKSSFHPESL